MGLETATYISGLTETWPVAGDPKSQGDDHLRLIKATLKSTFPNADKAFYFPKSEATSGTLNLDGTDMNNMITVTTTGGNVSVNLPSLVSADKGWQCQVMKVSSDANAAIVSPPSGTISSKVGTTATIRVGVLNEPATFYWDGSTWYCFKWGPAIGSTENFDGATTPYGYLDPDGTTYSNTAFAELFAVLATTTLRDKRGRAEIGAGTGSGLTNRVNGTTYGAESGLIGTTHLPAHNHAVFLNDPGHVHPFQGTANFAATFAFNTSYDDTTARAGTLNGKVLSATTGITIGPASGAGATGNVTANTGGGTAFPILGPSIAVKKIIRAC